MTEKNTKLILPVKGEPSGQKRVTIPIGSDIEAGDYVEVKKNE